MRLPQPPDVNEVAAHTPAVAPVPATLRRPFWSVMIPTYNCAPLLRKTLQSVLEQDPGAPAMQIEVIDDCSTKDDPEAVVREVGGNRVGFYRQPTNRGATPTFNQCIERATGEWVHILHGDDMVMKGFYELYEQTISQCPVAVMVLGPVVVIDEHDRWQRVIGPIPEPDTPVIRDFVRRQATSQLGQFAGVVVRRDVYERVGGFCTLYGHVADWDMWFRVGQAGVVVTPPRPAAMYRVHSASDTSRLMVSGKNIEETVFCISTNIARLNGAALGLEEREWRRRVAERATHCAWSLDERGCIEGRLNQAAWAFRLDPGMSRFRMLAKSWLKKFLARKESSNGA